MPVQGFNKMKATSPSKLVQGVINQSWGSQQKGSTDPKKVLGQKTTKNPIKVGGSK